MIDWHSHILPGMDDGSRDTAESVALIKMQMSQGIDTVIATPHFYANDETVGDFLERRRASLGRLKAEASEPLPEILLGAEVRYYQGISRMEDLGSLRIEGSRVLLLEMPMSRWTESMVRELIEMSGRGSMRILLAHVDRYFALQRKSVWERIFDSGILIQANADFFVSFLSGRGALSLLKKGNIQCIGSDCHSLKSRPPRIGRALELIKKKLGGDYLCQMDAFGRSLLTENKK